MGEQWLDTAAGGFHTISAVQVIFLAAVIFLGGGVLVVCVLFVSRIKKSSEHRRNIRLRERFQKILNAIVINETFSQKATPVSAFEYRMAELRAIIGVSSFARQVLITQILDIKKNLSGSSSKALVETYYALDLQADSHRKLRSLEWKKKAQGIRELAEMGNRESTQRISKFLNARNTTLREESFMALVRLESERPLFFLDDYTNALTPWMRLNIFNFLQKLDPRKLPDFSRWFHHPNLSVRLFSISMTRQFRQSAALPAMVPLLATENNEIAGAVLKTLGELEAFQYRENVLALADRAYDDEKLAKRFLRCLGSIGDPSLDATIAGKFLDSPFYDVRFEAATALKRMGEEGNRFLSAYNQQNGQHIAGMLRHLAEPLLQ